MLTSDKIKLAVLALGMIALVLCALTNLGCVGYEAQVPLPGGGLGTARYGQWEETTSGTWGWLLKGTYPGQPLETAK